MKLSLSREGLHFLGPSQRGMLTTTEEDENLQVHLDASVSHSCCMPLCVIELNCHCMRGLPVQGALPVQESHDRDAWYH